MPRHKKGTLVRIKPNDESNWWEGSDTGGIVEANGYIFRVLAFRHERHQHNDTGEDEYLVKSLATGNLVAVYPSEITSVME